MPGINVYLPEDLAKAVKDAGIAVSPICQAALREELERVETITNMLEGMEDLEVTIEDRNGVPRKRVFEGRWLVYPDPDDSRAESDDWDAGAYYGVALTGRGRIAVYAQHVNERWPAELNDYDELDDVPAEELPDNLRELAAEKLGEKFTPRLDI
jgi:post-segregation antitoxin (ccd killing protein)